MSFRRASGGPRSTKMSTMLALWLNDNVLDRIRLGKEENWVRRDQYLGHEVVGCFTQWLARELETNSLHHCGEP